MTEEGEPGVGFFVIVEGSARGRHRRRARKAALGPGDAFGEMALIDDGPALGDGRSRDRRCAAWRCRRGISGPSSRSTPTVAWAMLQALAATALRAQRSESAISLDDVQLGARDAGCEPVEPRTGRGRRASAARARARRRARRRPGPAGSRGPRTRSRRRSPPGRAFGRRSRCGRGSSRSSPTSRREPRAARGRAAGAAASGASSSSVCCAAAEEQSPPFAMEVEAGREVDRQRQLVRAAGHPAR